MSRSVTYNECLEVRPGTTDAKAVRLLRVHVGAMSVVVVSRHAMAEDDPSEGE
jgi:hypothetical protein